MTVKSLSRTLLTNLGLRIFFYLAVAIIVAAVALNFLFYRIQEKQMVRELQDNGRNIASLFAENIRLGVFSQSEDLLAPPVRSLLRKPGLISVCIFNDRNQLLYARKNSAVRVGKNKACDIREYQETTDATQISDEGSMVFRESVVSAFNSTPEDDLYFEGNAKNLEQKIGSVLIRISAEKLIERRRTLLYQSIVICLAFLAILLPLTFVIVNESTRPLKKLLVRLRGTLPPRDGKTTDIDSLDHTFSTLIGELENSFKTIESFNNDLERKVEERTRELQRINADLEKTVVELKQAQMQLIQSEKMASLGQLATGLAHEINNSLVLIKGSFFPLKKAIEQLMTNSPPVSGGRTMAGATIAELFHHIDSGVFRITSLLTDLMTFARPGISTRKPIDLNNELELTLRLLHIVSGKEIKFIKEFSPLHPVLCHESQIAQVFFNILLNAIQAIDREGSIRITTAVKDDFVTVVFADNGKGIEPEYRNKIFDPFFTTKERGSGTGLGLSICYAIIKEHGGEIEVTSEVGKGTVFAIRLPYFSPAENGGAAGTGT